MPANPTDDGVIDDYEITDMRLDHDVAHIGLTVRLVPDPAHIHVRLSIKG